MYQEKHLSMYLGLGSVEIWIENMDLNKEQSIIWATETYMFLS